jgi:hypothetical protein
MTNDDLLIKELNRLKAAEVAALLAILREYRRAKKKHPDWPVDDLVHASAIINEEAGELTRECLQYRYECASEGEHIDRIAIEATQTGAMGFRFLVEFFKQIKYY